MARHVYCHGPGQGSPPPSPNGHRIRARITQDKTICPPVTPSGTHQTIRHNDEAEAKGEASMRATCARLPATLSFHNFRPHELESTMDRHPGLGFSGSHGAKATTQSQVPCTSKPIATWRAHAPSELQNRASKKERGHSDQHAS